MDNTVIALVSLAALIMLYETAKHFLGYLKSATEYRKLRSEQEKALFAKETTAQEKEPQKASPKESEQSRNIQ